MLDLTPYESEINEPINLTTIASYLSYHLDYLDIEIKSNLFDNIEKISYQNYDIIGIAVKIGTFPILDRILKKFDTSNKLLVLGNTLATYLFNEIISKYHNAICVRFEGEFILRKIINLYYKNKCTITHSDLRKIPNIAYYSNNKITTTQLEIFSLKNYPKIDRKTFNQPTTKNIIYRIEGSRGCSWNQCTFCSIPGKYSNRYRPL
ncbi:MAG: hypothetical protein Q3M24_05200 [Candidatus Electrothrix aestuarii]|uniref:B12-binding domain-containing protein n=1 Tax=Candidatus Electrothrix aestuarii TaxID=3062594 RepID=A0AAU8LY51_9BACT